MNTDRIRCTEAREKLPLYVGGDLDPDVLASVRAHLEVCPDCAARAGSAGRGRRALLDALLERGDEATQPELWGGIQAVLVREGRIRGAGSPVHREPASGPAPRRWAARVLAPLAAAAAVVLVAQLARSPDEGPGGAGRAAPVVPPLAQVSDTVPVVLPVADVETRRAGGLQQVPADEALRARQLIPLRRQTVAPQGPGDPGISLTGFH